MSEYEPSTLIIHKTVFLFLVDDAPFVQTECPSGSKCVTANFCDAKGVMSNTRVSITQHQKQQRGNMIVRID